MDQLKARRKVLLFAALFVFAHFARAAGCKGDAEHFTARHEELIKIFEEDQNDRAQFETMHDDALDKMVARDAQHLKIINKIADGNCLRSAEDYSMAAKIMMHMGKAPQLIKAYTFAKKAMDLGENTPAGRLTLAQSIDRYLVLKGYKQLFASQALQNGADHCWCLNSVQKNFPDEKRLRFGGRDLDTVFDWVDDMNKGLGCHLGRYCKDHLRETPRGMAPGIW